MLICSCMSSVDSGFRLDLSQMGSFFPLTSLSLWQVMIRLSRTLRSHSPLVPTAVNADHYDYCLRVRLRRIKPNRYSMYMYILYMEWAVNQIPGSGSGMFKPASPRSSSLQKRRTPGWITWQHHLETASFSTLLRWKYLLYNLWISWLLPGWSFRRHLERNWRSTSKYTSYCCREDSSN